MNHRKVIFVSIPLRLEMTWIYGFLFYNTWGWEKRILNKHPKLKAIYSYKTKKERELFLKSYIMSFRKEKSNEISRQVRTYKKEWQRVEKKYFAILAEILETSWPKKRKKSLALISINPICPRFIDDWSFSIFYDQDLKTMLETVMHETCHFLYFKKWKEVFLNAKDKTFESPYLEWHLSEILAPVILQDPRIQKLLHKKPRFYNEHNRIKIGNKSVPTFFTDLYNSHLKQNTDFANFLKEAYRVIKKNRKLFKF